MEIPEAHILPCPFGFLPRPFCPKPLPPPFLLMGLLEYTCCGHLIMPWSSGNQFYPLPCLFVFPCRSYLFLSTPFPLSCFVFAFSDSLHKAFQVHNFPMLMYAFEQVHPNCALHPSFLVGVPSSSFNPNLPFPSVHACSRFCCSLSCLFYPLFPSCPSSGLFYPLPFLASV